MLMMHLKNHSEAEKLIIRQVFIITLVGGFNPSEKY